MNNSSNTTNREQQLLTWTQIISDCQAAKATGTKVKDWLKANNISKDTYYYWYREVKDSYINSSLPEIVPVSEVLTSSNTSSASESFTNVSYHDTNNTTFPATPSVSPSSSVRLSINVISIEVNKLTNPELLTNVIKAVHYA